MAKQRRDDDSFTSVLRGPGDAPSEKPRRGKAARSDQAAEPTSAERFGWDLTGVVSPGSAPATPAPVRPVDLVGTDVAQPPERILVRMRPHARRLTLPVLVLFATCAALGYFGGQFPEQWQNWTALGVAAALVLFVTLLPFLAWLGHRYTITSRRIIARRGLLVRHRQDVYLARVTDVRLRRGPLQSMFRSGDVRVVAGPDLTLVLHDVPNAQLVASTLGDLTEHPSSQPERAPGARPPLV
jgi:membrane protein YdbS with pleckstrin-like domain